MTEEQKKFDEFLVKVQDMVDKHTNIKLIPDNQVSFFNQELEHAIFLVYSLDNYTVEDKLNWLKIQYHILVDKYSGNGSALHLRKYNPKISNSIKFK